MLLQHRSITQGLRDRAMAMWRLVQRRQERAQQFTDWRLHGTKWAVSKIEIAGAQVSIGGWALATPRDRQRLLLTCNGQPFDHADYPIKRPDVAAAFPKVSCALESGFTARTKLSKPVRSGDVICFECVDRDTRKPLGRMYYPHFHRMLANDELPTPEQNRRQRVSAQECQDYFLTGGALQHWRFDAALREATGRGFDQYQNVLDWGCGCGRLGRYFRHRTPQSFTGVDVDDDNIVWCQKHMPFGRFETIPLHPPTQFPEGTFDLAFGYSVFTHLTEPVQFEWLGELRRLLRADGIALLTVHGDAFLWAFESALNEEQRRTRHNTGFVAVANRQYDAQLAEEDYYQNIFHTHAYIQKHWSKYFQILDIIPGYLGNQDLVIAKRTK